MSLYDSIPKCLLGKYQLAGTVSFACFFALAALLLTSPFIWGQWLTFSPHSGFWLTLAYLGSCIFTLAVSRVLMYMTHRKSFQMSYFSYILWCFSEAFVCSAFYVFYTWVGGRLEPGAMFECFGNAFIFVAMYLGVPYVLVGQFFVINDKDNTIRLMNFGSVATDTVQTPLTAQKITLCDDSGSIKLVVNSSNLFYIESDDNYIKVRYQDTKGEMKQYMLRCRLKTVEDSFSGSDLVRCHRKYIVNITKAEVISREKDGYYIDLGIPSVEPIPVSKTYEENVLSRFNSRA